MPGSDNAYTRTGNGTSHLEAEVLAEEAGQPAERQEDCRNDRQLLNDGVGRFEMVERYTYSDERHPRATRDQTLREAYTRQVASQNLRRAVERLRATLNEDAAEVDGSFDPA